jgi:serine/threonine protein kinase
VLFSYIDQQWKIADFGCTAEATSKRLRMTTKGRGTAVYRSPEIYSEDGGYNSKSDMWAVGCIAYELFTKQKAFSGDWETMYYRHTCLDTPKKVYEEWSLKLPWEPDETIAVSKELSKRCVDDTLQVEWEPRPSALNLLEFLKDSLSRLDKQI